MKLSYRRTHTHARRSTRKGKQKRRKKFAKFPKVMQTFFTYIDFPLDEVDEGDGPSRSCYDRLKLGAIKIIYYFA